MGRFFIVGAISTTIDFLLYALLVSSGLPYTIAIVIGYLAGLLVNFHLTRTRVFPNQSRFSKLHQEFLAIFLISIVAIALNICIVWALAQLGIDYYSARVMALVLVFFFNYYARKGLVYVR